MSDYDMSDYYKEISKNTYDINDVKTLLLQIKSTIPKNQPILIHPYIVGLGKFTDIGKNSRKIANAWYELLVDALKDYAWALPAFSYDFTKTGFFNKLRSGCDLDMLSKKALSENIENRTSDPVFSFTLMGNMDFWRDHGYFDLNIQDSIVNPFGKDGFFDKFSIDNGNIIMLGYMELYTDYLTHVHYLENSCNIDYRYYKNFTGTIDNNQEITYEYLVKPMGLGLKYKEEFITDYDHNVFILGSEEHKFNKAIVTNTKELAKNLKYINNIDMLSPTTQKNLLAFKEKVGYPFTLDNCG